MSELADSGGFLGVQRNLEFVILARRKELADPDDAPADRVLSLGDLIYLLDVAYVRTRKPADVVNRHVTLLGEGDARDADVLSTDLLIGDRNARGWFAVVVFIAIVVSSGTANTAECK
jgi:hypothetical protein